MQVKKYTYFSNKNAYILEKVPNSMYNFKS